MGRQVEKKEVDMWRAEEEEGKKAKVVGALLHTDWRTVRSKRKKLEKYIIIIIIVLYQYNTVHRLNSLGWTISTYATYRTSIYCQEEHKKKMISRNAR